MNARERYAMSGYTNVHAVTTKAERIGAETEERRTIVIDVDPDETMIDVLDRLQEARSDNDYYRRTFNVTISFEVES